MAEKYGEVPKRFTKAWWEYFWDYYKWHTISILAVILIIGTTVYSKITEPKYYFNVSYAADYSLLDESENALRGKLSDLLKDTETDIMDGVGLNAITFMEGTQDPQVEMTMITKLQLEFTDKNTIIYIFDDNKSKYLVNSESMDGAFLEVGEWLLEEADEDELMVTNGKAYAVKLDDEVINACGIKSENLYVAIRTYNEELDDEMKEKIANAKVVANAIVG